MTNSLCGRRGKETRQADMNGLVSGAHVISLHNGSETIEENVETKQWLETFCDEPEERVRSPLEI